MRNENVSHRFSFAKYLCAPTKGYLSYHHCASPRTVLPVSLWHAFLKQNDTAACICIGAEAPNEHKRGQYSRGTVCHKEAFYICQRSPFRLGSRQVVRFAIPAVSLVVACSCKSLLHCDTHISKKERCKGTIAEHPQMYRNVLKCIKVYRNVL